MSFDELIEVNKLLENESEETKNKFKELSESQRAMVKMLMDNYANSAMHAIAVAKQVDPDGDGILKGTTSIKPIKTKDY